MQFIKEVPTQIVKLTNKVAIDKIFKQQYIQKQTAYTETAYTETNNDTNKH